MSLPRENLVLEVINMYSNNNDIEQCALHVSFIGEEGEDFDGLTREMFTLFWVAGSRYTFHWSTTITSPGQSME